MTIATNDRKTDLLACNGTVVDFSFSFRILSKSDLIVYLYDADLTQTTLTLDTDYTISGESWSSGGTITTVETYSDDYSIQMVGKTPNTQETAYPNLNSYSPLAVMSSLDKLTMITQENTRDIDRAIKVGYGNSDDYSVGSLIDGYVLGMRSSAIVTGTVKLSQVDSIQARNDAIANTLSGLNGDVTVLKAVATANNTTLDDVAFLSTDTSLTGQHYFYLLGSQTTFQTVGQEAITGTVTAYDADLLTMTITADSVSTTYYIQPSLPFRNTIKAKYYLNISGYSAADAADNHLSALADAVNNDSDWRSGFGKTSDAIELYGSMTTDTDLIFTQALTIYGNGASITFNSQSQLLINNPSATTPYVYDINLYDGDSETNTAATDKALLEIVNGYKTTLRNVLTSGGNTYRRYGIWLGSTATWAAHIDQCRCSYSLIGLRIGGTGDVTNTRITGGTYDHNKFIGILWCNPYGGSIDGAAPEHNEGKYGIVVISGANSSSNLAQEFTICNVYGLDIGANYTNDSVGLLMGQDITIPAVGDIESETITSSTLGRGWKVSCCLFSGGAYGIDSYSFTGGTIEECNIVGTDTDVIFRGTSAPTVTHVINGDTGSLTLLDYTTNGASKLSSVYVSDSGDDDDAGTSSSPVATWDKALSKVKDGGAIYISGATTISGEIDKSLTIYIEDGITASVSYASITSPSIEVAISLASGASSGILNCLTYTGFTMASGVLTIGAGISLTYTLSTESRLFYFSGSSGDAVVNIANLAALTPNVTSNYFASSYLGVGHLNIGYQSSIDIADIYLYAYHGTLVVAGIETSGYTTAINGGRIIIL